MKNVWLVSLYREPEVDEEGIGDPGDWEFYLECTTGDQKGEVIYVTFTGIIDEDGDVRPRLEDEVLQRMRAMANGLMREGEDD